MIRVRLAVFPLTSLCLSCSTCKMGIMETLSSWCYFEHITNCSCVGVLPIVQMDLAMNGENLKDDKSKPDFIPGIKILC